MALLSACALAIILAHAVLVAVGTWRYDEYDTLYRIRDGGLSFVLRRIVGWSPRPLSELILYGYSRVVEALHQPVIGWFLGLLWLLLVFATILPTLRTRRSGNNAVRLFVAMALSVIGMFLVGHQIDEVFYWTQGAAAYLTTLAAIAAIAMLHVSTRQISGRDHHLANSLAVMAALCSETGAAFAIAYGGSMLVARHVVVGRPIRITRPELSDLSFLFPVLSGVGVFLLSFGGRLGVGAEAVGDPSIVHRLLPSLLATIRQAPAELLPISPMAGRGVGYVGGLAVALLFGGGVFGLLAASGVSAEGRSSLRLLAVGLSVLAAALVSLFAAYYQFGLVCCSRHETMRRCFFVIASVCLAAFIYSIFAARLSAWVGRSSVIVSSSLLLLAALAKSSLVSYPLLAADLGRYDELRAQSQANWRSGMSSAPWMEYRVSGSQSICGPQGLPPGIYTGLANMPPHLRFIAKYFEKSEIRIINDGAACQPL